MENLNVEVIAMKRISLPRLTEDQYFREIRYQHFWKPEAEANENIFVVTMSDQLYNPETKKELVVSVELHFKLQSKENILSNFQDPEKRHRNAIPTIARLTFEAQKILREQTLKEFNKDDFQFATLPEMTLNETIAYVIEALPKRDTSNMPIVLNKDESVANYVISMFSTISDATSPTKIEIDGRKIMIIKKPDDEKFEFDEANYAALKSKIIFDFFRNPRLNQLTLSDEESKLFRRCSHAAYYFEGEKKKRGERVDESLLKIHEKYFR